MTPARAGLGWSGSRRAVARVCGGGTLQAATAGGDRVNADAGDARHLVRSHLTQIAPLTIPIIEAARSVVQPREDCRGDLDDGEASDLLTAFAANGSCTAPARHGATHERTYRFNAPGCSQPVTPPLKRWSPRRIAAKRHDNAIAAIAADSWFIPVVGRLVWPPYRAALATSTTIKIPTNQASTVPGPAEGRMSRSRGCQLPKPAPNQHGPSRSVTQ